MNKILLFAVSSALLAVFCFAPVSAETGTSDTPEVRFLNDFLGYIYQSEIMYGDVLWALEAFDRFDQERDWESLQLARASLALARKEISGLKLPQQVMTLQDQIDLMQAGIDISFMESIDDQFQGEQTAMSNACVNLHFGIMDNVFLQRQWKIRMRHAAVLKKTVEADIRYLANNVDWVLASLDDEETTKQFTELLAVYCPLVHAYQSEELGTPESIESEADQILNQLDAIGLEDAEILGALTNNLNYFSDILERGELAELGKDMTEISDMPPVLFYPEWFNDRSIYYYWKENGEILPDPVPGTVLDRIPDGCLIKMEGVTQEAFSDYLTEVREAGLPYSEIEEDEGKLTAYYEYFDSVFAMIWENGKVSVYMMENPICFVPRWYLPALQAISGEVE